MASGSTIKRTWLLPLIVPVRPTNGGVAMPVRALGGNNKMCEERRGCYVRETGSPFKFGETKSEPVLLPTNSTTRFLDVLGVNPGNVCARTAGRPIPSKIGVVKYIAVVWVVRTFEASLDLKTSQGRSSQMDIKCLLSHYKEE